MSRTVLLLFILACCGVPTIQAKESRIVGEPEINLQTLIDQSSDGDTLILEKGTWYGPVVIYKTLTIVGNDAVIDGKGKGRVLTVDAPNVDISGLQINNSGTNLRKSDSCVYVSKKGEGSKIHRNRLSLCTFGIWVNRTSGVTLHENTISGKPNTRPSELGNGIHLFDGSNLLVTQNNISKVRDGIYVSVTEDSLIKGNTSEQLRYGIHYMYSNSNTVESNISHHNTHGYAIMESHDLKVIANVAYDNKQHGILIRDAEDCHINYNVMINNGDGLFVYASADNSFSFNWLENNKIGAKIWGGSVRNQISENVFLNNQHQVLYVANRNMHVGRDLPGNFWSDYLGWDKDGNKMGDRPYEVNSFLAQLIYRFPSAMLLLRSPSLELLSFLQQRMAVLRSATLIDHGPIMEIPLSLRGIDRPGISGT